MTPRALAFAQSLETEAEFYLAIAVAFQSLAKASQARAASLTARVELAHTDDAAPKPAKRKAVKKRKADRRS